MTQLNTDYLLQVTTAIVDRTYSGTGVNGDASKFNEHLSQASTLSGDDSRNLSGGFRRTDTARIERDDPSWNTRDSKPESHDSGNVTSSQTSPSDQDALTDDVSGTQSSNENDDGDERETDTDDSTDAAAAGAGQGTKANSTKSDSKLDPEIEANRPVIAKAAAINKKAAANAGVQRAAGKSEGQATDGALATSIRTTQHG